MSFFPFDLEEEVAAFFHNEAGGFSLAVEGVGGDDLSVQSREFFQQVRRRRLLAAFRSLFLVVNGQGLRSAVLVLGQR
jgi:hypothetical protein